MVAASFLFFLTLLLKQNNEMFLEFDKTKRYSGQLKNASYKIITLVH
jgi:hypothetical protein